MLTNIMSLLHMEDIIKNMVTMLIKTLGFDLDHVAGLGLVFLVDEVLALREVAGGEGRVDGLALRHYHFLTTQHQYRVLLGI